MIYTVHHGVQGRRMPRRYTWNHGTRLQYNPKAYLPPLPSAPMTEEEFAKYVGTPLLSLLLLIAFVQVLQTPPSHHGGVQSPGQTTATGTGSNVVHATTASLNLHPSSSKPSTPTRTTTTTPSPVARSSASVVPRATTGLPTAVGGMGGGQTTAPSGVTTPVSLPVTTTLPTPTPPTTTVPVSTPTPTPTPSPSSPLTTTTTVTTPVAQAGVDVIPMASVPSL